MPVEEFYINFAGANFGSSVAQAAGHILAGIDGTSLPEPASWQKGPGAVKADPTPWSEVKKRYVFVDELAASRPNVPSARRAHVAGACLGADNHAATRRYRHARGNWARWRISNNTAGNIAVHQRAR